ncbi:MAG: hypothetical protein WKG07_27725 [Hymenobacter sp.]
MYMTGLFHGRLPRLDGRRLGLDALRLGRACASWAARSWRWRWRLHRFYGRS